MRRLAYATIVLATLFLALAIAGTAAADTCDLDRSQELVAGDGGFVGITGVSQAEENIPPACQGENFTLVGSNPGDDFDIVFRNADGDEVGSSATPGDEQGQIPSDAVEAEITYWAGAGGHYTLTAPQPEPVTTRPQLYLTSGPTGFGMADLALEGSTMTTEAPQDDVPSVWRASSTFDGTNPTTFYDANWQWAPPGGFHFENTTIDVTFWAASVAGSSLGTATFEVELYVDGDLEAGRTIQASPPSPTSPARFTASFTLGNVSGDTLTFLADPVFASGDDVHAIYYNSTAYPSGLELKETQVETVREDLEVGDVGANHVQLTWGTADASDLDHYRVYRNSSDEPLEVVAEPESSSYIDRDLAPATGYNYSVAAVSYAGDEIAEYAPVNVTTDQPDLDEPNITASSVQVRAGATTASLAWTHDNLTEARLAFGPTENYTQVRTAGPAEDHRIEIGGLEPSATTHLNVTVTDLAGNTNWTGNFAFNTSRNQTLYFHNRPAGQGQFLDAFDTAGDAEPTYNDLGGALATANAQPAVTALPVRDVFPARSERPVTADLRDDDVEATVYVKDLHESPQDDPRNGNETRADLGGPNRIELNLTVRAGDEVVAQGSVAKTLVGETDWTPFDFSLQPQVDSVDAGSLRAILRAETATSGFAYGYEGDHASSITLPLEEGLDPQVTSVEISPDPVVAGTPATLAAESAGAAAPNVTWDLDGDGAADASGPTVSHTFDTPGEADVSVTVTDDASGASGTRNLSFPVRQGDFVNDSRTVVAVLDTGINPYHPTYQRQGIDLPLDQMRNHTAEGAQEPRTIDLADSGTWEERVRSYRKDRAELSGIDQGELVHFNDTNILGVSFADRPTRKILDSGMHGTATSSTVLSAFPDATVVMVQIDAFLSFNTDDVLEDITEGLRWTVDQPWIDVISMSLGIPTNAPTPSEIPELTREAVQDGKIVVNSAGNDPSPLPTDSTDGPPWVLSVTGSQADGRAHEIMSGNFYPDYTSDYTVEAAASQTTEDEQTEIGGTSFSAPTVAGTVAGIVHEARQARDHDGGIEDGNLVQADGPASPAIDNEDVRDVVNRTAVLREDPSYVAGIHWNGDHTHPPAAPYVTAHWGHVDERIIPDATADLLQGDLDVPTSKTDVWLYKQQTHETRKQYWAHVGN